MQVTDSPGIRPGDRKSTHSRSAELAGLARFQVPVLHRSLGQLGITFVAYAAIVFLMYESLQVSFLLSLALTIPAAGLVVRIFIIQHDCGHASFFRSRRANEAVGLLCSLVTFTPYANWRRQHAGHHAVWNNLDQRPGGADIYSSCLTLREYEAMRPWRKWLHRAALHPLFSQLVLPPFIFLVAYRVPFETPMSWRKERRSVYWTNLALLAQLTVQVLLFGAMPVLLVQLPIMIVTSIVGVWLFAIQHRFEDSQWARKEQWTPLEAAVHGCSLLRLPPILQWFSGNIGFHHVHHLLPRVPNYSLQACHEAAPAFAGVTTLTLREAFRAPLFVLWDEVAQRMVRFPKG